MDKELLEAYRSLSDDELAQLTDEEMAEFESLEAAEKATQSSSSAAPAITTESPEASSGVVTSGALEKPMTLEEIYQATAQGEDPTKAYWAANLFPRTLGASAKGGAFPVAEGILDVVSIPGRAAFSDPENGIDMGMSPEEAATKGAGTIRQIGMSPETYIPTPGAGPATIGKNIINTGIKAGAKQALEMGAKQGATIAALDVGAGDLDKAAISLASAPIFGAVQGALAGGLKEQAFRMVVKYMKEKGLQPTRSGVEYILSKVHGLGSTAKNIEKDLPRAAKSINLEDGLNALHPSLQAMRTPEVNKAVQNAIEGVSASRAANKISKEQAAKSMDRIQEFAEDYKDLLAQQATDAGPKLKNPMFPKSGLTREQKNAFAERYKDVPELRRAIVENMGLGDEYTHAMGYLNYPRATPEVDLTKPLKSSIGNIWQPEHLQRASNVVTNAPRGAGVSYLQDMYGSDQ